MDFQQGEILNFNKPLGWSSFKLVNHARYHICRRIRVKRIKVGHAGTLDPLATGVMIVCTGKATKRISEFQYQDKEYVATLRIGATTPSFDNETPIDGTYPTNHITQQLVETTLQRFKGEIEQIPPLFSAVKINGKRAYEIARKGKEIDIKPKKLRIEDIRLLDYQNTTDNNITVKIKVVCGKGTYIRALARDLGKALNSGAYLIALERTRVGTYSVDKALDPFHFKEWLAEQQIVNME